MHFQNWYGSFIIAVLYMQADVCSWGVCAKFDMLITT